MSEIVAVTIPLEIHVTAHSYREIDAAECRRIVRTVAKWCLQHNLLVSLVSSANTSADTAEF
jgi:hypothetical protein